MKIIMPATGLIEIESNEEEWHLLQKKAISEITTSAVISTTDERKIKVTLLIGGSLFVKGPSGQKYSVFNSADDKIVACILTNITFAINSTMKDYWILRGCFKDEASGPVLIQYFPRIKTAVYTIEANQEVGLLNVPTHMSN